MRGTNTTIAIIVDPSNASTACLGALSASGLPPLFRHRLSLSCVVLRCFPLSQAARRRTASFSGGCCAQRVAKRGRFALGTGTWTRWAPVENTTDADQMLTVMLIDANMVISSTSEEVA